MYVKLCNEKGLAPSTAALKIGLTKTAVSNWKARKTKPTPANLIKIADFFGVDVDYLKGIENKPDKSISTSDIKFALWGGDAETISDEMLEDVKRYAQFIKEQNKKTAEAVDEDK